MESALWPDAMFFDVDGVLIDSLDVKGAAFADVFDDIPGSRQVVIDYHLTHGGVTRSEKISNLFQLLTGNQATDDEIRGRVDRFRDVVEQRVTAAPEILGVTDMLTTWFDRCPLFAVSATPEDELISIFGARGLSRFFISIHGWPPRKSVTISAVAKAHGLIPSRSILLGDSYEDFVAAKESGVHFIHFQAPGRPALEEQTPSVRDFLSLDRLVPEILGTHPH